MYQSAKVADVDVDKRIELIRDSSVKDVYNVITANPFKVISEKGFMFKTNEPFEQEKMCFNADLIDQLSDNDLHEIRQIIDKKLELYFSSIDEDCSLEEEFNLWMKWQPQRKSPALLYKQNTIDTMVSILRKGSAAFNSDDNSVANCFNINDAVAFDDFAQRVYDKATYLGSQLECEFGGDRCFGIAANMDFLLVCTYEENGENPELVIYKKR